MQKDYQKWGCWLARYVLYVIIMLAVYGAVYLDVMGGTMPEPPTNRQGRPVEETVEERQDRMQSLDRFGEDGMLESMELAILLTISMTCIWLALRQPEVRTFSLLMAGFTGMMAIREQDKWFDSFRHGAWVYPEILLVLWMVLYAWKHWNLVKKGVEEFVTTPGWGFFASGCLMTLIFSRLMGQKFLWNHMIHSPWVARNIKDLAEEGIETAGYALMLCSLIEGMAYLHRRTDRENRM